MKNYLQKLTLSLFFLIGTFSVSYASMVNPKIEITHNENESFVEYVIEYFNNENGGFWKGDVFGWLHADVYAENTRFMRIDGTTLKYFDFPKDMGTIKEISKTKNSYRHFVTVRWYYSPAYSENGKTITAKVPGAWWERQKASDSNPNVVKSFTVTAKPLPTDFSVSFKKSNNELTFSWSYNNKDKQSNWKFFLFKREANTSANWTAISNIAASGTALNNKGTYTRKISESDLDKTWTYAIVAAKPGTTPNQPTSDSYFTKTYNLLSASYLLRNLKYSLNVEKNELKLIWEYSNLKNAAWVYTFFRREKSSSAWVKLTDKIDVIRESGLKESATLKLNPLDYKKEWVYAVSLSEKHTNTVSSESGNALSTSFSVHTPYPENLNSVLDTTTQILNLKWKYRNPDKFSWTYVVYKKKRVIDDETKTQSEPWIKVSDTLKTKPLVADSISISFKPSETDLYLNWIYAVSLVADTIPASPSEDYYTQQTYVDAISIAPTADEIINVVVDNDDEYTIPWGKYFLWGGIGLLILIIIVAVIIMIKKGFRF